MKFYLIFLGIFFHFGNAVKLPSYFAKCKEADIQLNECLKKSANSGWKEFVKGNPKYHIISMNPLKVPFFSKNIENVIKLNISNGEAGGFEDITFTDIELNTKQKYFHIIYKQPVFKGTGDVYVQANLFGLTVDGEGYSETIYTDSIFKLYIEYDLIEKQNKQYIEIKNSTLSFQPQKLQVLVPKIFKDEKTEKQIQSFINENWKILHDLMKVSFNEIYSDLFGSILKQFFRRVPYSELFD